LLRHRLSFRCAQFGALSAGHVIEHEGSPFDEEVVNGDWPDDPFPCTVAGEWRCWGCPADLGLRRPD
jgi:hypothetical protein